VGENRRKPAFFQQAGPGLAEKSRQESGPRIDEVDQTLMTGSGRLFPA
jgi:hypothetical protein